jgi:FMN-dependent NADH-azoreductase
MARIIERDLAASPPPFPDQAFVSASLKSLTEQDDDDRRCLAFSESLIAELAGAGLLVIDTPMHNFTVPAVLKAWIDYVVRPERTFRGRPAGKIGLLDDRPAFLIVASGGPLSDSAISQKDFLVPYIRYVLATIGIRNFRFVLLDSMRRGQNAIEKSESVAREWIAKQIYDLPQDFGHQAEGSEYL